MSATKNLKAVEAATNPVRQHVRAGLRAIENDSQANAYGVLMRPAAYAAHLRAAVADFNAAALAIDTTKWPTDADYGTHEREHNREAE